MTGTFQDSARLRCSHVFDAAECGGITHGLQSKQSAASGSVIHPCDIPAMPFAGPLEHFFMPDAEKVGAAMKELAEF
jgi:hypothetical protein